MYKKVVFSGLGGLCAVGVIGLSYATGSSHAPATAINQAIEHIAQQHALTQIHNPVTGFDSNLDQVRARILDHVKARNVAAYSAKQGSANYIMERQSLT